MSDQKYTYTPPTLFPERLGIMQPYLILLKALLHAPIVETRNATTRQRFGAHLAFDLRRGFPLLARRRMAWRWTVAELVWFLLGSTDLRVLQGMGCRWWDAWEGKGHDGGPRLGPIYGQQLRRCLGRDEWGEDDAEYDQLRYAIDALKESPTSRRAVISLWHLPDVPGMALPPCHGVHIQMSAASGSLDLMMTQRSADAFLGLPVNIASYALLQRMIAHELGIPARFLHIMIGDAHLYTAHEDAARELLGRRSAELPPVLHINPEMPPVLHINPEMPRDVDKIRDALAERLRVGEPIDDVLNLTQYEPQAAIKAELIP